MYKEATVWVGATVWVEVREGDTVEDIQHRAVEEINTNGLAHTRNIYIDDEITVEVWDGVKYVDEYVMN